MERGLYRHWIPLDLPLQATERVGDVIENLGSCRKTGEIQSREPAPAPALLKWVHLRGRHACAYMAIRARLVHACILFLCTHECFVHACVLSSGRGCRVALMCLGS